MTQPRRVFLAHAQEDKERVRALYKQIKQSGFNPWLDEEDLIPGQTWKIEIEKVIREAGIFIACLSKISVQKKGYVQTEFRLALTAYGERPPGAIYFIPVRLDECKIPDLQIPNQGLSIRDFQWLDLWQEGGFERLIEALEKSLGTTVDLQQQGHHAGEHTQQQEDEARKRAEAKARQAAEEQQREAQRRRKQDEARQAAEAEAARVHGIPDESQERRVAAEQRERVADRTEPTPEEPDPEPETESGHPSVPSDGPKLNYLYHRLSLLQRAKALRPLNMEDYKRKHKKHFLIEILIASFIFIITSIVAIYIIFNNTLLLIVMMPIITMLFSKLARRIYRHEQHLKDIENALSKDWVEVPAIVIEPRSVMGGRLPAYVGSGTVYQGEPSTVIPARFCYWYSGHIYTKEESNRFQRPLNEDDNLNLIIDKSSKEVLFIKDYWLIE